MDWGGFFLVIHRKETIMKDDLHLRWREDIEELEGFPGYYLTDQGRVFSYTPHTGYTELKQRMHKGYKRFNVVKDGKTSTLYTHRAVAHQWLPSSKGLVVNHKDEDKTNNRLDNLEWVTITQNRNYGTGVARSIVSRKKFTSTEVLQLDLDGKLVKEWKSAAEIARVNHYRYNTVCGVIQDYPCEFKGYLWKRKTLKSSSKHT